MSPDGVCGSLRLLPLAGSSRGDGPWSYDTVGEGELGGRVKLRVAAHLEACGRSPLRVACVLVDGCLVDVPAAREAGDIPRCRDCHQFCDRSGRSTDPWTWLLGEEEGRGTTVEGALPVPGHGWLCLASSIVEGSEMLGARRGVE